jgi:hypothetical protein
MPHEPFELAKINITYRRDPDAAETMTLSDGASEVVLYPSALGGMSMLLNVIGALVRLIPYGGELDHDWMGAQADCHWRFQLDGDILRIQVYKWGTLVLSTTCSL